MSLRSLSLWWLASALCQSVASQSIAATNSTPQFATSNSQVGLLIARSIQQNPVNNPGWSLLPLTNHALGSLDNAVAAPIVPINSMNFIVSGRIAMVQCDETNSSNLTSIVQSIVNSRPRALVLYSNTSSFCSYTANTPQAQAFVSVWTMTNWTQGQWVLDNIQNVPSNADNWVASLVTSPNPTSTGNSSNNGRSSQSTAVAMIILYSITGVITALFLIIIVTGAIRAHRHPERYGPRNVLGRTRQSRARGLARAIVDTLPIVKFGEEEAAKPGAGDVEMAGAATARGARAGENGALLNEGQPSEDRDAEGGASRGITAVPSPDLVDPKEEENPGCSICTDDFERGQDVRVLPCGHTFHPPCIDPWLLNVSGTCPLCRVDLRPSSVHSNRTTTSNFLNAADSDAGSRRGSFAPPLTEEGRDRRSSRFSLWGGVLNPTRMEHASREERIAALRRVRDHRDSVADDEAEVEVEARRRRRLTARLHDAFHIRTRARSASRSRPGSPDVDQDVPTVPDMPQAPPAVHSPSRLSQVSIPVATLAEPVQSSSASPLQSPVSLTFPSSANTPAQRPSHESHHPTHGAGS